MAVCLYCDRESFPDIDKVIQVFQIQIQTKSYIAKYQANTITEFFKIQIPATVISLSSCGHVITPHIT